MPLLAGLQVLNVSAQERIISWCTARHVTELYVDQVATHGRVHFCLNGHFNTDRISRVIS